MTTPAYFNTADRLIRFAMEDAGLLQDGDDPTSEQFAKYLQRLNDLINLWQTKGLKLWLLHLLPVPLIAGQNTYTFKPGGSVDMTKPLRVLQGFYLTPGGTQQQLIPLSWNEWITLPQTNQQGAINSYFVDKQPFQLNVSFWLTPDTTAALGTAHLLVQTQVSNYIGVTDSSAFPQEWFLALRWGLADEIATGQPGLIMDRCERRAKTYLTALEDWDVEDADTRFAPDENTFSTYGRFR